MSLAGKILLSFNPRLLLIQNTVLGNELLGFQLFVITFSLQHDGQSLFEFTHLILRTTAFSLLTQGIGIHGRQLGLKLLPITEHFLLCRGAARRLAILGGM